MISGSHYALPLMKGMIWKYLGIAVVRTRHTSINTVGAEKLCVLYTQGKTV